MFKRLLAVILCFVSCDTLGSETEIECLAKNIYFEARGENAMGQFAVAFVTLNRVKDNKFPNSICEVVYQARMKPSWRDPKKLIPKRHKCQFSWYCDGKADEIEDWPAYERAITVARVAILGIVPDLTEGSLYYHNNKVDPYWNSSMLHVTTIDNHLFYKVQ